MCTPFLSEHGHRENRKQYKTDLNFRLFSSLSFTTTTPIIMSKSIPPTFNPHANHYFTSNGSSATSPQEAYYDENPYIPIPSPHTTSPSWSHNSGPFTAPHPSSIIPSSTQFSPMHAPPPRLASKPAQPSTSPPIFVPFRPDKSSPELRDVLSKKKSASAWPAQPVFIQPNPNIPKQKP